MINSQQLDHTKRLFHTLGNNIFGIPLLIKELISIKDFNFAYYAFYSENVDCYFIRYPETFIHFYVSSFTEHVLGT